MKRLTKIERTVIDLAILRIEERRETWYCNAIKRVAGQLGMDDEQIHSLLDRYKEFFNPTTISLVWRITEEKNDWLDLNEESRQIRLFMLTMFRELYGKVEL